MTAQWFTFVMYFIASSKTLGRLKQQPCASHLGSQIHTRLIFLAMSSFWLCPITWLVISRLNSIGWWILTGSSEFIEQIIQLRAAEIREQNSWKSTAAAGFSWSTGEMERQIQCFTGAEHIWVRAGTFWVWGKWFERKHNNISAWNHEIKLSNWKTMLKFQETNRKYNWDWWECRYKYCMTFSPNDHCT